jgi:hypothetical protein
MGAVRDMGNGWDAFVDMVLAFLRRLGGGGEPQPHADVPDEDRPSAAAGGPVAVADGPGPEDPLSSGGDEPAGAGEGGDAMLKGKGIWAYREQGLARAIQIAPQMGATHVLYKVAHGANYRSGMAQVAQRIKAANLIPYAWAWLLLDDPQAEAQMVVRAFQDGFEGYAFDTEASQCSNRSAQATEMGRYLDVAGIDRAKLYNCSFPAISYHTDLPYEQLNGFCKGGLMPMSYGTYYAPTSPIPPEQQAQRVIDEWTYGQYEEWCGRWGYRPPLHPVLGPYHDEHGSVRMPPDEFQVWLDHLAAYSLSFFSVFTAAVINDDLLPLIRDFALGDPVPPSVPVGVKVEVVSPDVGFVNVRPSPSTAHTPITRVDDGEVLEALEPESTVRAKVGQAGQWLHVRTPGNVEGYVAAWYTKLHQVVDEPIVIEEPVVVVAGVKVEVASPSVGFLNLRPDPSTDRPPITRVDDGEVLDALEPEAVVQSKVGQTGQWLHVRTPGNVEGYVAAWYVRLYEEPGEVTGDAVSHLVVYSSGGLNVRPSANTNENAIWRVVDKTVLEVLENQNTVGSKIGKDAWIKVRSPSLHEGYVNGAYVRAKQGGDTRRPVSDSALAAGESAWIFGIHAAGATTPTDFRHLFQGKNKTGWVLFTEVIGDNPNHGDGHDFTPWSSDGYGAIVRLNNGYEPTGTLPVRSKYADFAQACAAYVGNSRGCHIWIVANEQNNLREHPGGAENPTEHISPEMYAEAFNLARQRIKAVQPHGIVVPGAVDPYFGLSLPLTGVAYRPLDYFKTMLDHIDDLDGIALHTYTHWLDVDLITAKTVFGDPPLDPSTPNEHYYDFQAYRTFAEAIPAKWRNRPIYLTESNHWIKLERAPNAGEHVENGWINKRSGWIQAAYAEIARWNSTPHAQQIQCYLVYRWTGDQWAIEGMGEVQADFKEALDNDYRWRR